MKDSHTHSSSAVANASAIRALYQELMDGWNRGSAEAFAAAFTEDGVLIGFDGTRFDGHQEIIDFHQPLFETHLKGSQLVGEVTDVSFLAHDVALFHAHGGTIMRGKSAPSPERNSIQTLVAVRRGDKWRLAAFQNTRTRPMGRDVSGTIIWLLTDRLWRWFGPAS